MNLSFNHKNKIITDHREIANAFNDYFITIGPNLAKKIPDCSSKFDDYLPQNTNLYSLFLSPTNPSEIISIINKLPKNSAPGIDGIPTKIIQNNSYKIAAPLTHIINLSLSSGIVPDQTKLARVTPIFKSDDPSALNNYRPISVLSSVSKIFERIIYNRTINFLNKHNIISDRQFGFRQKYSTYMAALDISNFISKGFDNNEYTLGIFLDLSKAFDTVDHNILLSKLFHYGIRGVAHDWFLDYLSNRKQLVIFNDCSSLLRDISCGVPQGSILGPLLFILYINDLPLCSKKLSFSLFADDTSILYKTNKPHSSISLINHELTHVSDWFKSNKLSLNVKKTNFMLFYQLHNKFKNLKICIDDTFVTQTHSVKFLGLNLDPQLNWKLHINSVCNKTAKIIGVLYKISHFVPKNVLITLYHSLIYSHLSYCNIVWGNTHPTYLNRLFILQKKAIRIITLSDYRAHTSHLFKDLKILTLSDIHRFQLGIFMYKVNNNLLPSLLCRHFSLNSDIHDHFTRHSSNLHLYSIRSNIQKKSFSFSGTQLWNYLDNTVKNVPSLAIFSKNLKHLLLSNY